MCSLPTCELRRSDQPPTESLLLCPLAREGRSNSFTVKNFSEQGGQKAGPTLFANTDVQPIGGGHGRGLQGQVETGTKPPVQLRRPNPGTTRHPLNVLRDTCPQQAGPLLSRDTGPLEQPTFNTYSTTETADGSKTKSSVFFHWLNSTGPW